MMAENIKISGKATPPDIFISPNSLYVSGNYINYVSIYEYIFCVKLAFYQTLNHCTLNKAH